MTTITPPQPMPLSLTGLPEPDADARAHSARLVDLISREIETAGGAIPFARYMELALYAPGLGYYSAGSTKLGAAGDFITAPELSPLFARCLARQAYEILDALGGGSLVEAGAGSGLMACELLAELERLDALPEQYAILELSADLRERQQALLRERVPQLMPRVAWLDRLPDRGFNGLVIANELLDAMPVHLVSAGRDAELHVGCRDGRFAWTEGPIADAHLQLRVDALYRELGRENFAEGYRIEINLAMEAWIAAIAAGLERGALLVIDYGFPRREYYHPERRAGTLMCHYRHRAHDDPLILTGLQDITAHVDFTALAECAAAQGLSVTGYTSQAYFLLASGLQEIGAALADLPAGERTQLAQQIQRLTLPGEMGEKFKAIVLTRGLATPLTGFSLRDDRGRL
jgi:SAM-dependent MidA family methyltransferase